MNRGLLLPLELSEGPASHFLQLDRSSQLTLNQSVDPCHLSEIHLCPPVSTELLAETSH